jgi:hypothetical protein
MSGKTSFLLQPVGTVGASLTDGSFPTAIELFDGLWKLVEPFIPIAKAKPKGEDRAWRTEHVSRALYSFCAVGLPTPASSG